jgi:hypothetical protein
MTTPEPSYREIPLTQGMVALVSAHRFEEISKFKWQANKGSHADSFYAVSTFRNLDGKRVTVRMGRLILGLDNLDKREEDHKNRQTLDNRDENLRISNRSQNACNRGIQSNNTSGFKGVTWHKTARKWAAQINLDGKHIYLGLFDVAEEAFAAYCAAANQLHGEFATTK